MKSNLKKASLLFSGLLVGGRLLAQAPDTTHAVNDYVKPLTGTTPFRTITVGVAAGVLTTNTVLGSDRNQDFRNSKTQLGYSGFIQDQLLPSFGLRLSYLGGKVEGQNSQPSIITGASPYSSFNTKLNYAVALSGTFTLANISWVNHHDFVQPYVSAGFGLMGYVPTVTDQLGNTTNFKTDNSSGRLKEGFVPVGVGLKFNLSPIVSLDLGYDVNFVYSDNFDGYKFGRSNDRFSYAHAGLDFSLGKSSKPALSTHNPVASMQQEYTWQNEQTKSALQAQIDAEKAKNDQLRADLNTTNANLAKFTIDSDGDGVQDFFDKCPNTPAGVKVDGSGCPLPVGKPAEVKVYVTEQDKAIVKEAIRNLEFDFGKATIRAHSLPSLDKVAELLTEKKFHLKLAGYTDNVGGVKANLTLSQNRAGAIKTYLVSKGADESLITAEGYGKAHPIATNKTAKGRQINRRVEFSLY